MWKRQWHHSQRKKQEVKSIPRKWTVMGLENSGKKRVFIFSQNTIGVQNKQYRWDLLCFLFVKLDKNEALRKKTSNKKWSEANLWRWKWMVLWLIKIYQRRVNKYIGKNEYGVYSQFTGNNMNCQQKYENIYQLKIYQGHEN